MGPLRIALAAALIVAGAGCFRTSGGAAAEAPFPGSPEGGASTLTVVNNNWLDVVVYISVGGGRTSIVRASTNRTVTGEIPASLVKNGIRLRLLADFTGAVDDYLSESVFLRPGQDIFWTIEENPRHSSLWVY